MSWNRLDRPYYFKQDLDARFGPLLYAIGPKLAIEKRPFVGHLCF
jgi:hypothetical protein